MTDINPFDLTDPDDPTENELEAYCVRCKHMVEIEHPEPVWTSKGTPGTRGVCPDCGTTVFRMGKTDAHESLVRPMAVRVEGSTKIAMSGGRKRAQPATYINYAGPDAEFASRLAADLENAGIHTWIDIGQANAPDIKWAGGVHPALRDSAQMVVVLSSAGKNSEQLTQAWTFFKAQKKRIALALIDPVEAPDPLRRSARFDFSKDYKRAFRQLLSALSE
jgi:TIR domain/Domain of unknown function (DUF5679)